MTHWIKDWRRPTHVMAIQTTSSLTQYQAFLQPPSLDVHPNQSNPKLINLLVEEFDLPHVPKFLQQVHGNQVIEYTQPLNSQFSYQADACFTRSKGVICAVMTADCLPVLLTDSAGSFVAAVHCGWRSLYANILSETLAKINSEHPIFAWFGPCIQQEQYEVDESFVIKYLKQHANCHPAFTTIKAGKSFANLYTMARIQLNALGVKHVQKANQCTFLQPDYYSWRQNNTPKRMASMIWLKTKQDA